ncbi:hypothetical protein [Mesorhizobium sp. BR1-1-2]|uniref:hypothetical protein n=1 Tax=Mesorhizobium sp. BR1-1-2 TaxID=2876652 RepID=UPI001CC9F9C7|nr:hypothetical protein [Mesorhizobium sp. BR1-1-2]MBZ9967439.1 hypothetical protein [Mesorhizobium sp. BR1-1-2]
MYPNPTLSAGSTVRPNDGHFHHSWLIKREGLALPAFAGWLDAVAPFRDRQPASPAQNHLGRVIIPAPVLPTSPGDQRGGSMCKTLKTDIKLFAAAIVAAATVLGANVSLADVVAMLGGAK